MLGEKRGAGTLRYPPGRAAETIRERATNNTPHYGLLATTTVESTYTHHLHPPNKVGTEGETSARRNSPPAPLPPRCSCSSGGFFSS
jgi:hypothetical protein